MLSLCLTSSEYIYSEKVQNVDSTFDFYGKTYIPFKISMGTVTSTVEHLLFAEVVVRYANKILDINFKEALEKVYENI